MRIGIDIDGVLTDMEAWQLEVASRYYYLKYDKDIVNPDGYYSNQMFNADISCDEEFWQEYYNLYAITVPCRMYASEVINKLRKEGNEIYIVTARDGSQYGMTKEESNEMVRRWLLENNIIYDEICFSSEDKTKDVKRLKLDMMIEDKPANIMAISKIIPVICFHAGYNKDCSGENITTCYSWYDIYSKINKGLK